MKLAKEDIVFIDTYLKNSGVFYVDIRQEMIDHIATAVEEKMEEENIIFYDAFKAFMAANKKDVLKNNKISGTISWNVVLQFLLFLVKPLQLFLGFLMFLFFTNIDINLYFSKDFSIKSMFIVLILSLALFQILYFHIYFKKRFYVIEKTGSLFVIIYYIQLLFLPYGITKISALHLTLISFIFLGYILFFIQAVIKFNQHRFNYI
jgi:hypothetical protein